MTDLPYVLDSETIEVKEGGGCGCWTACFQQHRGREV